MKKRMKLLALVLAIVMAMTLTACAQSQEAQAQNEVYDHLREEAATQGVDLDAVIASEQAAYEERHAEYLAEQEAKQDFVAKLNEKLPQVVQAFQDYKSAVTAEDILETAQRYNALYDEYLTLAEDDSQHRSLLIRLNQSIGRQTRLSQCVYEIKAAYADFDNKDAFAYVWCYYDTEANQSWIVLVGKDEATDTIDDIQVLRTDGTVCKLDLSTVVTEQTAMLEIIGMNGDALVVFTVDNADYLYHAFRIVGGTSAGESTELRDSNYDWLHFDGGVENFTIQEFMQYWN